MENISIDFPERHTKFIATKKRHILMITNHGIHQWNVIPGLPDTGGQNVFVNQFTEALVQLGFKVTIANRGGYQHPETGRWQRGLHYRDDDQRILYLEDEKKEFVRKEDMDEQIPQLVQFLKDFLDEEGTQVDFILSHYWDAAKVGNLFNRTLPTRVKHIWVPHSVGALKKKNVNPEQWPKIRIDERIATEKQQIGDLDGVAATSSVIRQSLLEDYGVKTDLFLPPCVDADRFHARDIKNDDPIWQFLSENSGLAVDEIRKCKIVTEISRTDTTKRKNILIQAFAQAQKEFPNSFLVLTVDSNQKKLSEELKNLIQSEGIVKNTAVLGSVWDLLPILYAISDIYCSPSVMEGFGMAVQEAAATKVPVVSSQLVPFVAEYLLGTDVKEVSLEGAPDKMIREGSGAIVVEADFVEGFAYAFKKLLTNEPLRQKMGEKAYEITIPYFTWNNMVKDFLEKIGESV